MTGNKKRLENDQFLMKIIHDMALSKDQIRQINQCRLYKKITYLSEILNHDFQSFHPDLWEPNKKLESNVTERFPIIEVPKQYWDLWRNVITAVRSNNIITIKSFGSLHDKSSSRWLVSKDYRYIYKKCDSRYSVHRRTSQNKNSHVYNIDPIFLTNVTVYEFLEYTTPTVTAENIQIKSTRIQEPKARPTPIHHFQILSKKATVLYHHVRKIFQLTPSNHIQAPIQRPPTYKQSYYDDDKYTMCRKWWSSTTPTQPKSIRQLLHKRTIFTTPSDLDEDFLQSIQLLHPTLKHNLGIIQTITHLPPIIQALENGELIGVCDASVSSECYASHAYKLVT